MNRLSLGIFGICLVLCVSATAGGAVTAIKSSALFDYSYDFTLTPTDYTEIDLDGNGANDWRALGTVSIDKTSGTYTIGPATSTPSGIAGQLASRVHDATYWPYTGQIWPATASPPSAGPFTIEFSVKVLRDDDPVFGACALTASSDATQNGALFIKSSGQAWGPLSGTPASLIDPVNTSSNADDFHVFRVAMEDTNNWWVWRDGVLLNAGNPMGAAYSHASLTNTIRLGDPGSIVNGQVVVDYVRFTAGAYAPDTIKITGDTAGESLGSSVGIDGNIAVAGAMSGNKAYVLEKRTDGSGIWDKVKTLNAPAGQNFGRSVSVSGDTIIVGAYSAKQAYIYKQDQGGAGNWGLVDTLGSSSGNFGFATSISGDTAVVGAYFGTTGGNAHIYQDDGAGDWTVVKSLTSTSSYFGAAASISDDLAVIGALGGNQAFIYGRDEGGAGNWGLVSTLDGPAASQFGRAVAIDGDTIVVGASSLNSSQGAAYVYQDNGLGNWSLVDTLFAFDGAANDEFGYRVDISGDLVLIGTNYNGEMGADAGAAYIYQDNGLGDWLLVEKRTAIDAAAGDRFGDHVGITGTGKVYTTIVSAPGDGSSGAVYITRVPEPGSIVGLWLGCLVGLALRPRRR
ncbi:MAG: hypothetical protein U1E05_03260 [Patescibacteria group bacterium]|nr:hypothetical protein [Patescibacteria group bacterium]